MKIHGDSVASPRAGRAWRRAAFRGATSAGFLTAGLLLGGTLLGWTLFGGAAPLLAQNQPPADVGGDAEEQVEVVIPDTGIIRRQLGLIAPPAEVRRAEAAELREAAGLGAENPFAGKVLLVAADALYPPMENVEIRSVAGRPFLVVPYERGRGAGYQMWLPVDAVQSIHVFETMRQAEDFLDAQQIDR